MNWEGLGTMGEYWGQLRETGRDWGVGIRVVLGKTGDTGGHTGSDRGRGYWHVLGGTGDTSIPHTFPGKLGCPATPSPASNIRVPPRPSPPWDSSIGKY